MLSRRAAAPATLVEWLTRSLNAHPSNILALTVEGGRCVAMLTTEEGMVRQEDGAPSWALVSLARNEHAPTATTRAERWALDHLGPDGGISHVGVKRVEGSWALLAPTHERVADVRPSYGHTLEAAVWGLRLAVLEADAAERGQLRRVT